MPLLLQEEATRDVGRRGLATEGWGAMAPQILGVAWTETEATAPLVGTGPALLPGT